MYTKARTRLGGPSLTIELQTLTYIKQNEQAAIAAANFIRTLMALSLMNSKADFTNPNYIYKIWNFTKKYGVLHANKL